MPKFTPKSRETRTKQKLVCTLTSYAFLWCSLTPLPLPGSRHSWHDFFPLFHSYWPFWEGHHPTWLHPRMRHSLLLTSFDMGPTSTPVTTCPRPMALTQARHDLLVKARKQNSRNPELNYNQRLSPDFQTHLFPERKKIFPNFPIRVSPELPNTDSLELLSEIAAKPRSVLWGDTLSVSVCSR